MNESTISTKTSKRKPTLSLKLFQIETEKKSNHIKLTKSLVSVNPFYKKYNNTFVSNISKKMKNYIRNNINISSKLMTIRKNCTNG